MAQGNTRPDGRRSTRRISLTESGSMDIHNPDSTIVATDSSVARPPQGGMDMDQLMANYETILNTKAIFYPVAFQFHRELGRGRQGVVFLGMRQGARGCITQHAIKVFNPDLYRSAEEYWTDMGRIASQISKLHGVQSPHLVFRYTYEETYGIGYAQMESVDGVDLRHFVNIKQIQTARNNCSAKEWRNFNEHLFVIDGDRVALQPGVVVYILRRVLRGIERLHSLRFRHCDIKPANIMIDRLGTVKVVDFGRAIVLDEKVNFLLGSPMYMAPEMHQRKPGRLESDFFSIGLVGLELLTGTPLTTKANVTEQELLDIKLSLSGKLGEILPPHVKKRRTLTRILKRLLEPIPKDRYGSAEEAEAGETSLAVVDKQLTKEGEAVEYGRLLSDYLGKLVDTKTQRVETDDDGESRREPIVNVTQRVD